MPRFVILTHDHPFLHWDLMLEHGAALRTWRLLAEPCAGRVVAADRLPDHRGTYLDYEGPVSGGRGEVRRWDAGQFELIAATSTGWQIVLNGARLRGPALIEELAGDTGRWRFQAPVEPLSSLQSHRAE